MKLLSEHLRVAERIKVAPFVILVMALLGVAEYGTSSSSDSDSEDLGLKDSTPHCRGHKMKLPPPDLDCKKIHGSPGSESIFHNPYRKEHDLNIDTLSRHVLPSEIKEKEEKAKPVKQMNICRKFAAKGQCRFGDKCKFSHVVPETQEYIKITNQHDRSSRNMFGKDKYGQSRPMLIGDLDGLFDDEDADGCNQKKRKKRPGLPTSIIPSKKALAMYKMSQKK